MDEESAKPTITHHVAGQGGRYVAVVEGSPEEGYLEWEPGGSRDGKEIRVAAHTIVPRAIGGRGVAGALVDRLVKDAERQGFLIRPDCSYVARKFSENPDWAALKA
ncbi:GNAT family N-acetyltransferase [Erythrobacter donghaensis]|jgi:predicted GNAT family acetyltransferase|uniref:GNAT family N-acetyltransferase n=1 Tax=Erythrobacter donghaensis TaxID=267135 RepID=UPI00093D3962|nr:GNAT family N-acetyltransferase [Erythrobacter donghaensis]